MQRRRLLAALGAGTAGLAGCVSGPAADDGTPDDRSGTADEPEPTTEPPLPADCPTTQGLGVEWPSELDAAAVESFVERYERRYYRDVVVAYEPESELDSYELSGSVTDGPTERGEGWELAYSGGGGVYRPTLHLGASTADPPADADVVPVSEIDDATVTDLLEEAAATGEAEHHVDPPGGKVDRYVDLFAGLSDDFEPLSERGDGDELYVDVDGTDVELAVRATNFHGDYWWDAYYYVDERVVRRATDEGADPRDGTLLECRDGA